MLFWRLASWIFRPCQVQSLGGETGMFDKTRKDTSRAGDGHGADSDRLHGLGKTEY